MKCSKGQNIALEYARGCVEPSNDKVGKYVKLQAEKWIDIVEGRNEEAFFDEVAFAKVKKLLGIIIHPDLNKPMVHCLDDYAWLLVTAVLCTKTRDDDGTVVRYYHTALLEIARKNRKTFYSAVIFILLMLMEPKFSRFFSVAPDLSLSSELKVAIRKIIKSSPILEDRRNFKLLRKEIRCVLKESEYTPLAFSDDKMDGKLANAFLADEAGALPAYPVEAMRSSQIGLKNKLGIIISTQYPNDDSIFIDEVDKCKKVLDGYYYDKRIFSLLYEPDVEFVEGDKWQTEDRVLYQANPVSVTNKVVFRDLIGKRTDATLYENKRENFLCKHSNIKYKSLGTEGYIEISKVKLCAIPPNKEWWEGRRVYLALDLAISDDNVAVVMGTYDENEEQIYQKSWGFLPTEKLEYKIKKEHLDYKRLIRKGNCYCCGEETVDYNFIENFIMGLEEEYGVTVVQLGYDRFNAMGTVQRIKQESYIECVEIGQNSKILHPATKWLKELILNKKFLYEENELLEVNFQNARCTEDTNLNKYVNKKKSSGKVDMVVATIIMTYLILENEIYSQDYGGAQIA